VVAPKKKPAGPQGGWALRLCRNVVLVLPGVALVWVLLTPLYNAYLVTGAEKLVRLGERPARTRLTLRDGEWVVATNADFGTRAQELTRDRATDVHFDAILLATLFLAVPAVTQKERWGNLGIALLCAAFFHLFLLTALVKFTYATQMGAYSEAHYGAWSRNFWGLTAHLLDLPFKFALPLLLWGAFYLRRVPRPA
jgi:hypothetical protein